MPRIDDDFAGLPLDQLADAALGRAQELGARHASARVERVRTARLLLRDGEVQASRDTTDTGLAAAVVCDGGHGFAASPDLTSQAAADAVSHAAAVARACAPLSGGPVELAAEPVHQRAVWMSDYRINPFDVAQAEREALLVGWSTRLLAAPAVDHVLAFLTIMQENKFYADLAGTRTIQQRVRVHPLLFAHGSDARTGERGSLRTLGPPAGRGFEYLLGEGWDWDAELTELPTLLAGKLRARPVRAGRYDLVLDPSNLWLTIHESVAHATELDRALGTEVPYAGGTFAQVSHVGRLRFGSPLMTITADRTTRHGLATTGFDDEGVAARSWTLVEDGVLTGFQTDRRTARLVGQPRSTGCAFAESARHLPLLRMPNVGLRPVPGGPSTDELISGVADGIYLVGSGSWSIDMQRQHFQFGAERSYRVRSGRLDGQLGGVVYQASTVEFWSALSALGGPQGYQLFGADMCGKGQPLQASAASHGSPAAVFGAVQVLDPADAGGL